MKSEFHLAIRRLTPKEVQVMFLELAYARQIATKMGTARLCCLRGERLPWVLGFGISETGKLTC